VRGFGLSYNALPCLRHKCEKHEPRGDSVVIKQMLSVGSGLNCATGGWPGGSLNARFPIDRFVVDFLCTERKLIIELDGGQHVLNRQHDDERTECLERMGYLVLRFWNNEVMHNTDGVLQVIMEALEQVGSDVVPR